MSECSYYYFYFNLIQFYLVLRDYCRFYHFRFQKHLFQQRTVH